MITVTIINPIRNKRKILCSVSVYLLLGEYGLFTTEDFENMLYDFVGNIPSNVDIRVYIDKNTKWLYNLFKYVEFMEFAEYDCPEFYLKDGIDHQGYFGYFVKCLPLFNNPEEYELIWISDISHNSSVETGPKELEEFIASNKKVLVRSLIHPYNYPSRITNFTKAYVEPPEIDTVSELRIRLSKIELPRSLLDGFFKDLLDGKYSEELEKIYKLYKSTYRTSKENLGLFPFETYNIFFDEYLRPYLSKMKTWVSLEYYVDLTQMFSNFSKTVPESKEIVDKYLPKLQLYKRRVLLKRRSTEVTKDFIKVSNELCTELKRFDRPHIDFYCDKFKRISKVLKDTVIKSYRVSSGIFNQKTTFRKRGSGTLKH